jgi:hypothetical protein
MESLRGLLKVVAVLVAGAVGIVVLTTGGFWLYLEIHPSEIRTTEVTPWLRLRRWDPTVRWPHLLQSSMYADEVLVQMDGDWKSAASDRRDVGNQHWGSIVLGRGEVVLAGFRSEWWLFRRGRAGPIFVGGYPATGDCSPAATPDGSSILCVSRHTECVGDRCRGVYRLQAFDLEGQRTRDVLLPLQDPSHEPGLTGYLPWLLHGFAANGDLILVQSMDRFLGTQSTYECAYVRVGEGARVEAAGTAKCPSGENPAPPGNIERSVAKMLP